MIHLSDREWEEYLQVKPYDNVDNLEIIMPNSKLNQETIQEGIKRISYCFPHIKVIKIDLSNSNLEGKFLKILYQELHKLKKLISISAKLDENNFQFSSVSRFMSSKLFREYSNLFSISYKNSKVYLQREQIIASFKVEEYYQDKFFVKIHDRTKHTHFEHFISLGSKKIYESNLFRDLLVNKILEEASISHFNMTADEEEIAFTAEGSTRPQQIIKVKSEKFSDLLDLKTLEDFGIVYLSANESFSRYLAKTKTMKTLIKNRTIFKLSNKQESKLFIISINNSIYKIESLRIEDENLQLKKTPTWRNLIFNSFLKAQEDNNFLDELTISNFFELQIFTNCIFPKLVLDTFQISISQASCLETFQVFQRSKVSNYSVKNFLKIECLNIGYVIECFKHISQRIQPSLLDHDYLIQQQSYDFPKNQHFLEFGISIPKGRYLDFQYIQDLMEKIKQFKIFRAIEKYYFNCYSYKTRQEDLYLHSFPIISEMKKLKMLEIRASFEILAKILLSNQTLIQKIPRKNFLSLKIHIDDYFMYNQERFQLSSLNPRCFDSVTFLYFSPKPLKRILMKYFLKSSNLVKIYKRDYSYQYYDEDEKDYGDQDQDNHTFQRSEQFENEKHPEDNQQDLEYCYERVDFHDNPFCSFTRIDECTCNNNQIKKLLKSNSQIK